MRRSSLCAAALVAAGLTVGCVAGPAESNGPQLSHAPQNSPKSWTSALTDNPVTRGIGSMTQKGIAAVSPKPKVTPLADPISLNTRSKPGADLYVSMAKIREQAGQTDEALEHYRQALKTDGSYLPAMMGLAHLYDRQNRLADAERLYRQAAAEHPRNAAAYNDLGLCLARQNRLPESAQAIERAIALQPDKVLYRNNIATVLCELKRYDDALGHLASAHGQAAAHYNLGFMLHQAGDDLRAAEHFNLALRIDPSMAPAQQLLAKINSHPATVARRDESLPAQREQNFVRTELQTPAKPQEAAHAPQPDEQSLRYPQYNSYQQNAPAGSAPLPLPPINR